MARLPPLIRASAFLAWAVAAGAAPRAVRAQEPSRSAPAPPASAPIRLVVELAAGSTLDAGRLRDAIRRELGTDVVTDPAAPGGTLLLEEADGSARVSFEGPNGRHDARTLALAGNELQRERDIALVAVNVVRDQTTAFLPPPAASAAPLPPPAPARPTPAASPPAPAAPLLPCGRVATSSSPRTPFGIDFVPFAGTSSFDGGRSLRAASVGALGALSAGIDGLALSGLVNLDIGPVCGVQVAGLANVAHGFAGTQISGAVGVTTDDSTGLQLSLIEVATGRLRGAQIGLVNVAGEAGAQIGLVNVAAKADGQVGLVNVNLHGSLRLDVWAKPEAGFLLAGIAHGSAHVHALYAFEISTSAGRPWAALGLGARLTPSDRIHIDLDLLEHTQILPTSRSPNELSEVRALLSYAVTPHLSVFAGPTFNVSAASDPARADVPGFAQLLTRTPSVEVRAWPGVAIGLEGP